MLGGAKETYKEVVVGKGKAGAQKDLAQEPRLVTPPKERKPASLERASRRHKTTAKSVMALQM